DGRGRLVDGRGNKLEISYKNGKNENNVSFTKDNFLIDKDGAVFIKNKDKFEEVGKVNVYTAVGDKAFASIGENLFLPIDGANVQLSKDYAIYQGLLEGSNVDIGQEFTELIVTQRAFQLSSKSLTTADEMWGMINDIRR
ncbi:MAG: flagellar basal body rod C-terminal domain-containing protein, partial [Sarcina sp.]